MWVSIHTIKNMFEEARRQFDTELWIKPNKDWHCGREPTRDEIDEFLHDLEYKILKFQQSEAKTEVEKALEMMGEDEKTISQNRSDRPLTVKEKAERAKNKFRAAGYQVD